MSKTRRTLFIALGLAVALTLAVSISPHVVNVLHQLNPAADPNLDTDADGLTDLQEAAGWEMQTGTVFYTDPERADSDGDGLNDGMEAGELAEPAGEGAIYLGISNPLRADTDADGLSDAYEADEGTDPYHEDTDDDSLNDVVEVIELGTNPLKSDSDGDGFGDASEVTERDSKGLDPLFVDEETPALEYAGEFVQGALAGDAWRSDSLAWLAGNLVSSGASFIPGIGWIVGGIADARDAIASAIQTDWVGAGFSAVGLVPYVGDAAAIPRKVAAFVARNPRLAAAAAGIVVALPKLPEEIKIRSLKKAFPSWNELLKSGANKNGLIKLAKTGRQDLNELNSAMQRKAHVAGKPAKFQIDGYTGEKELETTLRASSKNVSTQVVESTAGCAKVCNATVRRFDVVADGVAHESKVGRTSLTEAVKRQIDSDAFLIENGSIRGATWHFYPSKETSQMGATKPLLDFLESKGIKYSIHLPASS